MDHPTPQHGQFRRGVAGALLFLALSLAAATLAADLPLGASAPAASESADAWPHTLVRDGATVTVYQPQATAWPARQRLTARAALAIARPGQPHPLMGTIELTLATRVDEAAGIVNLSDAQLLSTHFPALDTQQAADMEVKVRGALAQMTFRQVPLAAVLLSLKQLPVGTVAVANEPPLIFYADKPASLVVFDGEPVLSNFSSITSFLPLEILSSKFIKKYSF